MSPVVANDPATVSSIRQRWRSGDHVGEARPVCRAYIRTGQMIRKFRKVDVDEIYSVIPGVTGKRIYQGKWDAKDEFTPMPNLKEVVIDQNYEENGCAQATITIDNIGMTANTVEGLYHIIERGYYAPYRGFKPPNRPRVGTKNDWFDKLHDKSSQIIILAGYGDAVMPVFLGLVNDVDLTSRPDQVVLVCRDMAQYLTDQKCFAGAKPIHMPDPITFADRRHADKRYREGHGVHTSSKDNQHPSRFATDDRNSTFWQSGPNHSKDALEWIEIAVPNGRYEDIMVNPKYRGMEMWICIYARDRGAPGGRGARRRFDHPLPQGWVDEGRGNVPGTGIPFVKHVARAKTKKAVYHFPDYGYILGDNSRVRLYFSNLDRGFHGRRRHKDYRAGVQDFCAWRRRTRKEAKRDHWILVDDLSDVARTVFQWCGINEWEVESTGVRLKDKAVFNRGDFLIDVINNAAEQVGYTFHMRPPDSFDEDHLGPAHNLSTGVAVFRQNQAMRKRPRGRVELVHEEQVLGGINAHFTDEPLAFNIRVRGKQVSKKKGGRIFGGDRTRRWMYVYRPPWSRATGVKAIGGRDYGNSNQWRNANVKKNVVHHDERLRTLDECKIACLFIAFREALESAKVQIEAPAMPSIYLDQQTGLFDTGTGLSTRFWVAQRSLHWVGGENGSFKMSLGGSLLELPDILSVRQELVQALDDNNYNPGLPANERRGRYGRIYRNN